MFFTEVKLNERLVELNGFRYRDAVAIPSFQFRPDSGEIGARPPKEGEWAELKVGERWGAWINTPGSPLMWRYRSSGRAEPSSASSILATRT